MRAAALRYRVKAYITGVLIIVVCFVGIPLQVAADNTWIADNVGTVHGFLYIIYIIVAYILAQKLKMRPWQIILLLLSGPIPILTFFVERWMNLTYIAPALAAESSRSPQQPVSRCT